MKTIKILIIFSILLLLFGCEDSLNGPPNSNLTYEPIKISIGQQVRFGTINKDVIKVKLASKNRKNFIVEYPIDITENCPLHATNKKLDFFMYNDKYKVTFNYSTQENGIILQLYNYQILQPNP